MQYKASLFKNGRSRFDTEPKVMCPWRQSLECAATSQGMQPPGVRSEKQEEMQRTHGAGITNLSGVTGIVEFRGTFKTKNVTVPGKLEPLIGLLSA